MKPGANRPDALGTLLAFAQRSGAHEASIRDVNFRTSHSVALYYLEDASHVR